MTKTFFDSDRCLMFEGKHIHFSPTDNKPLCSYSGKLCRQRRLNGYAFCIRHILEDKSAPFKQCSYVTRGNTIKCLNAIPTNQDRGYCHSHMQVVGIIPKTERKSKINSISKSDSLSSGSEKSLASPPTPISSNGKKDPGAVFKFEEDSSDSDIQFPYKNGLTTHATFTNGKGKGSKGHKDTTKSYSPKDGKNQTKTSNCFSGSFTTKKITDKNKNVYTAIIPTCNNSSIANQNNSHSKTLNSNKKTCWSTSAGDTVTSKKLSPVDEVIESCLRSNQKNSFAKDKGGESKLNQVQDAEDIRQFEQLKTLKKLDDKSTLATNTTSSASAKEEDIGSLRVFPRLASANSSNLNGIPQTVLSSLLQSTSADSTESHVKPETLSSPPGPAQIKRSSDGNIIKEKGQEEQNCDIDSEKECVSSSTSRNDKINNNDNCNKKNDDCNSIEESPDDFQTNRREFLARVRNTFKSQYKLIKKSSKESEKSEQSDKQNFRDSLMKCVKIDSTICAQVLLGYGLKLPAVTETAPSLAVVKVEQETPQRKCDYDDYEFFDTDSLSSPSSKTSTANFRDHRKNKKEGLLTYGAKKTNDKLWKREEEKETERCDKVSPSRVGQKRSGTSNSTTKGKDVQSPNGSCTTDESDQNAHDNALTKSVKNGKKAEKGRVVEITKDQKLNQSTPPSKRKLKRTDAVQTSVEGASDFIKEENTSSPKPAISPENISKKRKLGFSDLGLEQPTPSPSTASLASSPLDVGSIGATEISSAVVETVIKIEKDSNENHASRSLAEIQEMLVNNPFKFSSPRRNQGLETVLNSVGSSETAGTPDGVITDASFDSTFEHSTSSQQDCDFSEDDLEHSFELQIDPEIESQASRLLEDNVLTEADFTELFPDNRMSDHKFGRSDLQELGMGSLEFDVNDIDYSLFANIFPNFSRTGGQPESISISNQF